MSFFKNVKTGASYGFGGGFGFTLGQALARFVLRSIKLIFIALSVGSVGFCSMKDLANPDHRPAAHYTQKQVIKK